MPDLSDLLYGGAKRSLFYIQEAPREPWHVESEDHCEYMLCGKFISVDAPQVRIQYSWGPKKCFDCFVILKKQGR